MANKLKDIHKRWLYLVAILLLFPALFINLGLMSFIDDEAIRALVALEMKLSGNYIVPTMHGAFYYSKPPLFNWLLILFYNLGGVVNEWTTRIPTVLALMGYGFTIYYFFRKHFDKYTAIVNAFLLITCGRILFWDSMLGLIDITYSWVTFTAFMVVFHEFKKGNHLRLFAISYFLTAIGFMLKGFPSILFQGFTLITWFLVQRQFKQLFTWKHVLPEG
jgi:4-amino-4-deoxy-L-arabinose transferase-like glycosyltransferase